MSSNAMRFAFGKNWQRYVRKHFSDERMELSRKCLLGFLNVQHLEGKSFLDVGCGSGLHSLAALRSGAAKILSFDLDQQAVKATKHLREFAGNPACWTVLQGSILDKAFLQTIEPADIVYSWGVLHHTGEMWRAVENIAHLMKKDGLLYIALYQDRPYFDRPMPFWLDVKQRYNRGGWIEKRRMELWYFWEFYLQKRWSAIPDFIKQARSYKSRGMEIYTDAVDWLGGWPFEFASAKEVQRFGVEKLGLTLANLTTEQANAEYLFKAP